MATKSPFTTFAIASTAQKTISRRAGTHARCGFPRLRAWTWRSRTGARLGWRIRSSALISLTRCHFAFRSRHVNQLGKSTRPCAAYIGSIRSFISLPTSVIQSACAATIAMAKMFTSTVRLPPHQRRVSAFWSTSRQLIYYATIRVGTMPLPLTAPPAFVPAASQRTCTMGLANSR